MASFWGTTARVSGATAAPKRGGGCGPILFAPQGRTTGCSVELGDAVDDVVDEDLPISSLMPVNSGGGMSGDDKPPLGAVDAVRRAAATIHGERASEELHALVARSIAERRARSAVAECAFVSPSPSIAERRARSAVAECAFVSPSPVFVTAPATTPERDVSTPMSEPGRTEQYDPFVCPFTPEGCSGYDQHVVVGGATTTPLMRAAVTTAENAAVSGEEPPFSFEDSSNLIINYLPPTMSTTELRRLFAPHGTIQSVNVVTDHSSGRSMGYFCACLQLLPRGSLLL